MNPIFVKLKTRTILSAIFFSAFVASAVGIAVANRPDFRYHVMVPFIAAYLFLPRRMFIPGDGDDAKLGRKINLWLSYLRVIYFVAALFILLALPKLLS